MIKQLNFSRIDGPGRWLGLVGAAIILISAVFLGALLFVVLLGAVAVLGSVIGVRLWWRRRLGAAPPQQPNSPEREGGRIIDAEYTVVEKNDE